MQSNIILLLLGVQPTVGSCLFFCDSNRWDDPPPGRQPPATKLCRGGRRTGLIPPRPPPAPGPLSRPGVWNGRHLCKAPAAKKAPVKVEFRAVDFRNLMKFGCKTWICS